MTLLIGADCATVARKTGLALGHWDGSQLHVLEVAAPMNRVRPAARIAAWCQQHGPRLLAIDAPLGWPDALRQHLPDHIAGAELTASADALFHRGTDDDITKRFGKRPLEVAANFIARTAHAALALLAELRRELREPIPIPLSAGVPDRLAAIEVYPAATALAHDIDATAYKETAQREERSKIIEQLSEHVHWDCPLQPLLDSADALDAVFCLLAGVDFLTGAARGPNDPAVARREGWIWVRDRRD